MKQYIVDAFAEQLLEANPASVFRKVVTRGLDN